MQFEIDPKLYSFGPTTLEIVSHKKGKRLEEIGESFALEVKNLQVFSPAPAQSLVTSFDFSIFTKSNTTQATHESNSFSYFIVGMF